MDVWLGIVLPKLTEGLIYLIDRISQDYFGEDAIYGSKVIDPILGKIREIRGYL